MVNPFHVRVRRKNPITGGCVQMALQLYQVDYRSHLLDFKIICNEAIEVPQVEKKGERYLKIFLLKQTI